MPQGRKTKEKKASDEGIRYEPAQVELVTRCVDKIIGWHARDFYRAVRSHQKAHTPPRGIDASLKKCLGKKRYPLTPPVRDAFANVLLNGLILNAHKNVTLDQVHAFVANPSVETLAELERAPAVVPAAPPAPPPVFHFTDDHCYFELSRLERRASDQQIHACFDWAEERLKGAGAGDIFLRSVLTWTILGRASPERLIRYTQNFQRYLSDRSIPVFSIDLEAWRAAAKEIVNPDFTERTFLRSHMEDGLVRATLIAWLRGRGNESELARRVRAIPSLENLPPLVRDAFGIENTSVEPWDGRVWLPAAIKRVHGWCGVDYTSSLARLFLLWLSGRSGDENIIRRSLESVGMWANRYKRFDDPLIRWGIAWLSGMPRMENTVEKYLRQTRYWVETKAGTDERLVRLSYLWLAGTLGTADDCARAYDQGNDWLESGEYRDDVALRVATLLYVAGRGFNRGALQEYQLRAMLKAAEDWVRGRNDQITEAAIVLARTYTKNAEVSR